MRAAIAALHAAHSPTLIGVRHHSAVLARVVPQLLDRIEPETVLIELPADLQSWLEHVADEQTVAPIAISAVPRRGGMFFYPLADFSPELVAIRRPESCSQTNRWSDSSTKEASKTGALSRPALSSLRRWPTVGSSPAQRSNP